MCDICGTGYYRSALTRRSDGMLYCDDPGCSSGMNRVEIAEALKAQASGRNWPIAVTDGGNFDHRDDPPPDGHHPLPVAGPSGGEVGDLEDP